MEDHQFKTIVTKLDSILKLLALNNIKGKNLRDQVSIMASIGFDRKQIADILGKTLNHISVVMHDLRKKKSNDSETLTESDVEDKEMSSYG